MLRVRLAVAVGLALTAVALGLVLAHAPLTVAGTNEVPANFAVVFVHGGQRECQYGGTVPEGTTAVRISYSANIGPKVMLGIFEGSRLVTSGERQAGWGVDETVTVPMRRVAATVHDARLCESIGEAVEPIQVNGVRLQARGGTKLFLRAEYMRPGPSSWLALVGSVARRLGYGHAPGGAWVAYVLIAAMLTLCALISRVLLRELT
jgi:hypothetical protein